MDKLVPRHELIELPSSNLALVDLVIRGILSSIVCNTYLFYHCLILQAVLSAGIRDEILCDIL
jgi:hypothetical protein